MAKPKVTKGRGHVTAESGDRASNSLPTTKATVAVKRATPTASGSLPAPSKPGRSKTSGGGSTASEKASPTSGASRSTSGKTKPSAISGASRSTRGKVSEKSGASRSTKGKTSEKSGASRSTAGKVKPEGFIKRVRKTLADGFKGGFMKKNRKD